MWLQDGVRDSSFWLHSASSEVSSVSPQGGGKLDWSRDGAGPRASSLYSKPLLGDLPLDLANFQKERPQICLSVGDSEIDSSIAGIELSLLMTYKTSHESKAWAISRQMVPQEDGCSNAHNPELGPVWRPLHLTHYLFKALLPEAYLRPHSQATILISNTLELCTNRFLLLTGQFCCLCFGIENSIKYNFPKPTIFHQISPGEQSPSI